MSIQGIRQVAKTVTRPAPIKGINAYDSIVAMGEGYALILRNFFAQPYGCQVRRGYVRHVGGIPGNVETVCAHNMSDGKALYCFSNEGVKATMYNVTDPAVPAASVLEDLSNARWQHINFANPAGTNLLAVNGADDMIWVDHLGNVSTIAEGDGTSNTIKNIDPKKLIHIYSHQKRVWFVEKDSTRGWYLPPDQIFGDATMFDFGALWTRGGYLNQVITWTIDDGNGADDRLVAISSEGEVAVYQGIDPNEAASWSLVGVYYAGSPIGRRSACKYGGDVLILTQFGTVMLSSLLKSTKVNPAEDNAGKYIQQLVSNAATVTGDLFGWQPFVYPGSNMLILNVPATNTSRFQFVMNDITKAWSEFLGYEANCWELYDQHPVFGAEGAVYRAWEGTTDGAYYEDDKLVAGEYIRAEAQTSFSYFGELTINKHYKMVRPCILSTGQFAVSLAANTDFSFKTAVAPAAFQTVNPGRWDEDLWNSATWGGGLSPYLQWQSVVGIGFVASLRLLVRSDAETYWTSTDWLVEPGGVM